MRSSSGRVASELPQELSHARDSRTRRAVEGSDLEGGSPLSTQGRHRVPKAVISVVDVRRLGSHPVQLQDGQIFSAPETLDRRHTDIEAPEEEARHGAADSIHRRFER